MEDDYRNVVVLFNLKLLAGLAYIVDNNRIKKWRGRAMGCFGYICKGCNTSIIGDCFDGGEKAILIHVRHGEELGRVEGHYNEYGGVIEQKDLDEDDKFRGNGSGINSHDEICESELRLFDSYEKVIEKRRFNGQVITYENYLALKLMEDAKLTDIRKSKYFPFIGDYMQNVIIEKLESGDTVEEEMARIRFMGADLMYHTNIWKLPDYEEFLALEPPNLESYSGIIAWHSLCYENATEEEKADLTPSKSDPNQSWGEVRDKYK